MQINRSAFQAGVIEPMAIECAMQESAPASSQPAPESRREKGVRYALLAIIVLLLAWLGYSVQSSINEINSDMEKTHASMVTEGSLGPD
jgi:hypothetical protein